MHACTVERRSNRAVQTGVTPHLRPAPQEGSHREESTASLTVHRHDTAMKLTSSASPPRMWTGAPAAAPHPLRDVADAEPLLASRRTRARGALVSSGRRARATPQAASARPRPPSSSAALGRALPVRYVAQYPLQALREQGLSRCALRHRVAAKQNVTGRKRSGLARMRAP